MANTKIKYREEWLDTALRTFIVPLFEENGYKVPKKLRVTCGWPAKGGLAKKKRTIGQAWSYTVSKDGTGEIFISPVLADPCRVLGVLIHEVIHHVVGLEHGHKKPFVDCMNAVGLTGKPTATEESEGLVKVLKQWIKELGKYPHAELDPSTLPKQSTRLLLLECECGLKIRVSQKWIDEYGTEWTCPCDGTLVHQE